MHDSIAPLVPRRRRLRCRWSALVPRALAQGKIKARRRHGARGRRRAELLHARRQPRRGKGGDEIVPGHQQRSRKAFQNVVLTQDWHTPGHISFASSHPGKKPFESVELPYGKQILWPDHCVQGTEGAAIHKGIDIPHAQLVIRKGHNPKVDSYSAFIEADGKLKTGLDGYLKRAAASRASSSPGSPPISAWRGRRWTRASSGLGAYVIEDACRGIDTQGSLAAAWKNMEKAGVKRIQSGDLAVPA